MRSRVISKRRGYEETIVDQLQYLGIPLDPVNPRDVIGRLAEYLVEPNALAAYPLWREEIVVVRENVDGRRTGRGCQRSLKR